MSRKRLFKFGVKLLPKFPNIDISIASLPLFRDFRA